MLDVRGGDGEVNVNEEMAIWGRLYKRLQRLSEVDEVLVEDNVLDVRWYDIL